MPGLNRLSIQSKMILLLLAVSLACIVWRVVVFAERSAVSRCSISRSIEALPDE